MCGDLFSAFSITVHVNIPVEPLTFTWMYSIVVLSNLPIGLGGRGGVGRGGGEVKTEN